MMMNGVGVSLSPTNGNTGPVSDFEVLGTSGPSTGMSYANGTGPMSGYAQQPVLATQISMTDITLEDARHRLVEFAQENAELQKYMKENNEMMKRQYDTLAEWKSKVHQANIANKDKFEQTKVLICTLRKENKELFDKIHMLEKDLLEKHKQAEDLNHETQLLFSEKQKIERQYEELKQMVASLDRLKGEAEETGQPEPDIETVLVKLSLDKEKEFDELRLTLTKRETELKESRSANEGLLNDLTELQKLKEQIQQDYQRASRELSFRMEAGVTLQSLNSVSFLHVSKKSGSTEEEEENAEHPGSLVAECTESNPPALEVEMLQQTTVSNLLKQQEAKQQDYEEQILNLQKTVQQYCEQKDEYWKIIQTKERNLQEIKTQHDQELAQCSKQYEDKMAEFARKLDNDKEEQLKQQSSTNENVETLKIQVMGLMQEVHEFNNKLKAANSSIDRKNARIREFEEKYNKAVQDLMTVEQQKSETVQSLQTRCQVLQRNYAQEHEQYEINKNELNSLRQSFSKLADDHNKLVVAFQSTRSTQVESEEITKLKHDVNKLTCQVIVAEEALTLRDETVAQLKKEMAGTKQEYDEKLAIFKAQAEVFRMDFDAERQAREKQVQEKATILQELSDLQIQNQQLLDEMDSYSRRQLSEMQQRVGNSTSNSLLNASAVPGGYRMGPSVPDMMPGLHPPMAPNTNNIPLQPQPFPQPADQLNQVEEFDFTCPICNQNCPDLDTLQIHVVECMEQD